jgi:shikimate kinase
MKKLKKLSNKEPKFKVVIFYGPFAVGKYTVAEEFHKQTGFKFFHNHHTYDLVKSLFERNTLNMDYLNENIRLSVIKEIAKAKINVVTTHAYSAKYVSKTGLSDPQYVKKIESIVNKAGGVAYFIHLTASSEVLIKRVTGESRKKFSKLKDAKIMRQLMKEKDWTTGAPVKNNIEIENSNLSPKQVVKQVRELIQI